MSYIGYCLLGLVGAGAGDGVFAAAARCGGTARPARPRARPPRPRPRARGALRPPRVGRDEDALEVVVAALAVVVAALAVVAALVVVVAPGLGADFFGTRLYFESQLLSLSGPINLWSGKMMLKASKTM